MPVYTIDSAYQKIREHFSRPDAVLALNDDGDCVYRGDDRCASSPVRCAVGALIPDEDYRPEMDYCGGIVGLYGDRSCDEIRETAIRLFGEEDGSLFGFLQTAQDAHDSLARADDDMGAPEFLDRLDILYREWASE